MHHHDQTNDHMQLCSESIFISFHTNFYTPDSKKGKKKEEENYAAAFHYPANTKKLGGPNT